MEVANTPVMMAGADNDTTDDGEVMILGRYISKAVTFHPVYDITTF